jgi:hypothetical protein
VAVKVVSAVVVLEVVVSVAEVAIPEEAREVKRMLLR